MNCEWDTAKFLIFSNNGIDLIYYSHFTSIAIFAALLLLTFLKLKPWPKNAFRAMAISYILWLACDLILWGNEKPDHIMFFWTIINLVEPLIFAAGYAYFVAFIGKRSLKGVELIPLFILLVPTLIMAPIGLSTVGFNYTDCDRNVVEGIAAYYNYLIEAVFILLVVVQAVRHFLKVRGDMRQMFRLVLATLSLVFLLASLLLANFLGTYLDNYDINQLGHIAVPVFAIILAYITIKYETLEPRIMAINTMSMALVILLFSLFFIQHENTQFTIIGITFILSLPLVVSLITGMRKEVNLRVRIEKLLEELKREKESVEHKVVLRTAELTEANKRLMELDEIKTEFISVAAHQLRTPLSGVKWTLDMMISGGLGTLTSEQQSYLKKCYESNERMIMLINDMLGAIRVDAGKFRYRLAPANIFSLIDDILSEMASSLTEKNLKVVFKDRKQNLPLVLIDTEYMRAVLQNLLENAIKYSKEGGQISIDSKVVEAFVQISIKDEGIGIKEADQKNIFTRFFRAQNAVRVETDGSGLGLFIAKGIIARHGGKIWFESKEAEGTTFHFTIPISK